MKISDAIKEMMRARSMKAPDVAAKLGVSATAVRFYYNPHNIKGKSTATSVTVDTAVDVAAALDYQLVLVPRTRAGKLPADSIVVDERVAERRRRGPRKDAQ